VHNTQHRSQVRANSCIAASTSALPVSLKRQLGGAILSYALPPKVPANNPLPNRTGSAEENNNAVHPDCASLKSKQPRSTPAAGSGRGKVRCWGRASAAMQRWPGSWAVDGVELGSWWPGRCRRRAAWADAVAWRGDGGAPVAGTRRRGCGCGGGPTMEER
jgi:hypothetical protein